MINLDKRILQFFWAALGMTIAYVIDYIGQNLGIFNMSQDAVIFLGLVIPVITKAIRNYCQDLENPLP